MKRSLCLMMTMIAVLAMFTSCSKETGNIDVSWQLLENQYEGANKHLSELTFTNNSPFTLSNDNWEYRFSWFRSVYETQPDTMIIGKSINGDYQMIRPDVKFPDLKPGESVTFKMVGTYYALNFTDAPTGGFFVYKKGKKEIIIPSGDAEVLDFPGADQMKRSSNDHLAVPTSQSRYEANKNLKKLEFGQYSPITPTPAKWEIEEGMYGINWNSEIFYMAGLDNEARYLQSRMSRTFGQKVKKFKYRDSRFEKYSDNRIILKIVGGEPESYTLRANPSEGILIYGADAAGVFYGIQSLLSFFPADHVEVPYGASVSLPRITVEDSPRFPFRGMHLDVSRSFHSKEDVIRFIDLLATYKMNTLHFHITDDEGWRIEIKDLPELTEIGAFRGYTKDEKDHLNPTLGSGPTTDVETTNGSGYYSIADFVDILTFARHRHIKVIPEIDMPGHVRSALKAMEVRYDRYMEKGFKDSAEMYLMTDFDDNSEYTSAQRFKDNTANPCMDGTYRFIEKVVKELDVMYASAGCDFNEIHIGGDEVPRGAFAKSPICQDFLADSDEYNSVKELHKYFARRFNAILKEYDIHAAGWEEIVCTHKDGKRIPDPSLLDEGFSAYIWNSVWGWGAEDLGYKIANAGFPIVMMNASNFYFDFAYNKDSQEPGLYWGGYTDTRAAWEFTPYDMSKCAEQTLYGDKVDAESFARKVKLTDEGRSMIRGLSGTLWGENLRNFDRVEYMAFPKILGLAERAWAVQPEWAKIDDSDALASQREVAWNEFVNMLGQRDLIKLDGWNVNFRIPLPGGIIDDGTLYANVRFPGLTLRYTVDGSEPNDSSAVYDKPVIVGDKTVKIAAFSHRGRKGRTAQVR